MQSKLELNSYDVRKYLVHGVENLRSLVWGADFDVVQLRKAPPFGDLTHYFLGRAVLSACRFDGAVRIRGSMPPGMIALGVLTAETGKSVQWGLDVAPGDLTLFPEGCELDGYYRHGERNHVVVAAPARDVLNLLAVAHPRLLPLPLHPMRFRLAPSQSERCIELIRKTLVVLNRAYIRRPSDFYAGAFALSLLGSLFDLLERPGVEDRALSAASDARLIRRMEDLLCAHEGEPLSVPELCQKLSVTRRTLERASRRLLDMSPAQYLLLMRLCAVRQELLGEEETVSGAATKHGFYELGRFSSRYRELFGELPSQTLFARRKAKTADFDPLRQHGGKALGSRPK